MWAFGTVINVVIWLALVMIWIAIAFWPAKVASRKGHSFIGYFLLSLLFWPLALILAYVVRDESGAPEQWVNEDTPPPVADGATPSSPT
jgi:hypothetical protein